MLSYFSIILLINNEVILGIITLLFTNIVEEINHTIHLTIVLFTYKVLVF